MRASLFGGIGFAAITFSAFTTPLLAAPVTANITATVGVGEVGGSLASNLNVGDAVQGVFIFDTDENNATSSRTTPSTVPGHEFTSFYDFDSVPYDASVTSTGFAFNSTAPVHIVVNDNLALTAAETNGIISDGIYDWIEITGSTTVDYCPLALCTQPDDYIPANGQEWTLALVANDANWFTDGSVIPDTLPGSYTAFLVGVDIDDTGIEIGGAAMMLDTMSISAVPVPAAVWLFGSGLLGLIGLARRRKTA